MLNRFNLALASLASKEESRYSISGILVTKDRTVVTDGRLLATVTTPDIPHENMPAIEGIAPSHEPVPFILPAKEALEISKAIPKKSSIPVLGNAFVESGEGETAKVAVTDLESTRIFPFRKIAGAFPRWEQVVPKVENAEISLTLDACLLVNLLKTLAPLAETRDKTAPVTIRFSDPESPIRIDTPANSETGQVGLGVLMPMKSFDDTTHAVRPRKLTIELLDGKVRNIFSDQAVDVVVVSSNYDEEKDQTIIDSCQHWSGKDISKNDSVPAGIRRQIERMLKAEDRAEEEAGKPAASIPDPALELKEEAPAAVDTKTAPKPAGSKAANGWNDPEVRAKRIAAIRAARAAKVA